MKGQREVVTTATFENEEDLLIARVLMQSLHAFRPWLDELGPDAQLSLLSVLFGDLQVEQIDARRLPVLLR